jgi:hypothetical protein
VGGAANGAHEAALTCATLIRQIFYSTDLLEE